MLKIYQGDCVKVMRRLPRESIDAIVCDPPYGLTSFSEASNECLSRILAEVGLPKNEDDSTELAKKRDFPIPTLKRSTLSGVSGSVREAPRVGVPEGSVDFEDAPVGKKKVNSGVKASVISSEDKLTPGNDPKGSKFLGYFVLQLRDPETAPLCDGACRCFAQPAPSRLRMTVSAVLPASFPSLLPARRQSLRSQDLESSVGLSDSARNNSEGSAPVEAGERAARFSLTLEPGQVAGKLRRTDAADEMELRFALRLADERVAARLRAGLPMSPLFEAYRIVVVNGSADPTWATLLVPRHIRESKLILPAKSTGFMGKTWDGLGPRGEDQYRFHYNWARAAYEVLKPGGYLLAFGGTRTYHRLVCGVEDAGFEIRDYLEWVHGQGFPKSLDVAKAIDARDRVDVSRQRALQFTAWVRTTGISGAEINKLTGSVMGTHFRTAQEQPAVAAADLFDKLRPYFALNGITVPDVIEALVRERTTESENLKKRPVTGTQRVIDRKLIAPVPLSAQGIERTISKVINTTEAYSEAAKVWEGWGTALKPAHEPILVARKPFPGSVSKNVLKHGTGALNIDGSRVPVVGEAIPINKLESWSGFGETKRPKYVQETSSKGRWPPNLLLSHSEGCVEGGKCEETCAVAEMNRQSGGIPASFRVGNRATSSGRAVLGKLKTREEGRNESGEGFFDAGGASRFFPTFRYEPKPATTEREVGLRKFPKQRGGSEKFDAGKRDGPGEQRMGEVLNTHPTVKPVALMSWLIKLVLPPGGVVLDPFLGSGTTLLAAQRLRVDGIGIEREAEYVQIAAARIKGDNKLLPGPEVLTELPPKRKKPKNV